MVGVAAVNVVAVGAGRTDIEKSAALPSVPAGGAQIAARPAVLVQIVALQSVPADRRLAVQIVALLIVPAVPGAVAVQTVVARKVAS